MEMNCLSLDNTAFPDIKLSRFTAGQTHPASANVTRTTAFGGGRMLFVWTPHRIRIAIYFVAAYLALC